MGAFFKHFDLFIRGRVKSSFPSCKGKTLISGLLFCSNFGCKVVKTNIVLFDFKNITKVQIFTNKKQPLKNSQILTKRIFQF